VFDRRLLIVTGKGGAGRSAVCSAIARSRAAAGERVLALAIDRGAGLRAHFGSALVGHTPVAISQQLHGAVVDPAAALDEYIRTRSGSLPFAMAARIFKVLALTVPGVRDIVLLGKAWQEAERGGWDAVVVDAPPAGQIESVLRAPSTIAELVPRGAVHEQALEVQRTLASASTTELVVVMTAEELSTTEARGVIASADAAGISSTRTTVANRVLPPAGFASPPQSGGPIHDAAVLQLDVAAAQQATLAAVHHDLTLPMIFGTHRPTDLSTHLAGFMRPA